MIVNRIQNQSPDRTKTVAGLSPKAMRQCVQLDESVRLRNRHGNPNDMAQVDVFNSVECGIATAKKTLPLANQPVENKPIVFLIEKNRATLQIARFKRADLDDFSVANRRRHALSASFEVNRRVLPEKVEYQRLMRMDLIHHEKEM